MNEGHLLTGHQVLVANDDPAQLRAMTALLEAAGAEVHAHPDGRSVVHALIDGAAPSVIVTDLHMPGLDGWQLARLVRSTDFPGFGVVPLLITSATFAGADVEAVSLSAGASAFLAVPAPPERVVRYVHQLAVGQRPKPERSAVLFSEDATLVEGLAAALEQQGARASLGRPEGPFHQSWVADWVILDEDLPARLDTTLEALCAEDRRPALVVLSRDASPATRLALIVRGVDAVLPRSTPPELLADLLPQIGRQRSLLRVEQTLKSRAADLDLARDRWRDLFDAIPDMVLVLDGRGRVEASNAAARATFGGDVILEGRPAHELLSSGLWIPLTSGARVGSALGTVVTGGGKDVRVEATYRSFGAEADTRIVVLRDVTDRVEAEERQRSIEAQLFRGQKLESLGVMASGIAHDFNNLLLSILGNTALASDDLPEDHPGRHFVEQAGVAAERAAELTAQILAYSGEAQRTLQPVDVVQAVSELGSLLEPATSKKADLRVTHERREAWVEADPAQLRQVLMNLIVNASDALNGEAGIVSLRTAGVRLEDEEPSSWIGEPPVPGEYVRVTVQDEGCGIAPENLNRIFDPFFTTKVDGRGLGLAATVGILRAHGGGIQVSSTLGEGTTFSTVWPSCAPPAPEVRDQSAADPSESELVGGLILVVDDEPGVRQLVSHILRAAGYETVEAEHGGQAIEIIEARGAELAGVLLDTVMPVVDGPEALRRIKDMHPELPVIMTSGNLAPTGPDGDGVAAEALLQKPYRPQDLRDVVARTLRGPVPTKG